MKKMLVALVVVMLWSICSDAFARGRWRRSRYRSRASVGSAPAEYYNCSDQRKCELEAAHMNAHGIRGHIWGWIGNYEGVGWGGPGCATCTPRRGMALTGDAQSGNYRVRSWR